MFSGLTSQVSSWMGKKHEAENGKTEESSDVDTPVVAASDVIADGNKKDLRQVIFIYLCSFVPVAKLIVNHTFFLQFQF